MVRFKNRYFLCEVEGAADQDLTEAVVLDAIKQAYEQHFGERGAAHIQHGLSFKYFSRVTGKFLLKVPRQCQNDMQTVLALITGLAGRGARFRILHKSGTIKKS
jgi:RNase P/RNase MRP subunit POP5